MTSVVDLVTKQVLSQVEARIEERVTAAVAEARVKAEAQMTEWLGNDGQVVISPASADGKTDARDRARRTAIQASISTVVVAVLLGVAGVIGGNGFDWTNSGDWKAVGGAAVAAVVTVVTAYVHRLVSPPAGSGEG